jgi:hypothetical protein
LLPAISAPLCIEVRGGIAPPLILSLSEIHRYAGVRQLSPYSLCTIALFCRAFRTCQFMRQSNQANDASHNGDFLIYSLIFDS